MTTQVMDITVLWPSLPRPFQKGRIIAKTKAKKSQAGFPGQAKKGICQNARSGLQKWPTMQGQDYKNGLLLASTREAESDPWGILVSQFRQLVSPSSERDAVLKK